VIPAASAVSHPRFATQAVPSGASAPAGQAVALVERRTESFDDRARSASTAADPPVLTNAKRPICLTTRPRLS